MYDVLIVGAGVTGCAIARELSKYKLKTCVLEKNEDVANGTSKANSAIVHAGEDPVPGTLKAKLNVLGNSMYDQLAKELDFPFKRNGSLVLCFDKNDMDKLLLLKEKGMKNGVKGMKVLSREEVLKIEPYLSDKVVAALDLPTGGITCPYEFTIALAENACTNGVEFKLNTKVENIEKIENGYKIKTNNGDVKAKLVINAAGLFADELNNMVSKNKIKINPRKGEYCIFDKAVGYMATKTLFQLPTKLGKGILVTPTVDGNLLIGPDAEDIEDKYDLTTKAEVLDFILGKAELSIQEVPRNQIITSFCGLRARGTTGDFIIGEAQDAENFINVAAIESPGLSSAPAIAQMVGNIVTDKLSPEKNEKFNPIRKSIVKFRELNNEERKKIIDKNPLYGRIVCRCETVTEGEIVDAIRRPLGARSIDGVKKRTRAGMGRCQSGFCTSRVVDILSRELNIPITEVTKFGGESNLLVGKNKESYKNNEDSKDE